MSDPTEHQEPLEDEEDPNEVELAWAEEIRSRIDDVREGRVELIPGREVFAELRAMLEDE